MAGETGIGLMIEPNKLEIAGRLFESRLLMGTSGYPNPQVLQEALAESGTDLVTVAIRRVNLDQDSDAHFLAMLRE